MTILKETAISQIEATEIGFIQVRETTKIIEDGVVLSSSHHRYVIAPGDDYSKEDPKVAAICAVVHTQEAIAAYSELTQEPA